MSVKTYSISNDLLNGVVNTNKLDQEILESNLASLYQYINIVNDDLEIYFSQELDNEQLGLLDQIVTVNHNTPPSVRVPDTLILYVVEQDNLDYVPENPFREPFGGIQAALDWAYFNTKDYEEVIIKVGSGRFVEDLVWDKDYSWIGIEGRPPAVSPYDWALTLDEKVLEDLTSQLLDRYTTVLEGKIDGTGGGKLKYWRDILIDNFTGDPGNYDPVSCQLVNFELLNSSDLICIKNENPYGFNCNFFLKTSIIRCRSIINQGLFCCSLSNATLIGTDSIDINPVLVANGLFHAMPWGTPMPTAILSSDDSSAKVQFRTIRLRNAGFHIGLNSNIYFNSISNAPEDTAKFWHQEDKSYYQTNWIDTLFDLAPNASLMFNIGEALEVTGYTRTIYTNNSYVFFKNKLVVKTSSLISFNNSSAGSFEQGLVQESIGNLLVVKNHSRVRLLNQIFTAEEGKVEIIASNSSVITYNNKPVKSDGSNLKVIFDPSWNTMGKNSNSYIGLV